MAFSAKRTFEKAQRLMLRNERVEALQEYQKAAEAGHAGARIELLTRVAKVLCQRANTSSTSPRAAMLQGVLAVSLAQRVGEDMRQAAKQSATNGNVLELEYPRYAPIINAYVNSVAKIHEILGASGSDQLLDGAIQTTPSRHAQVQALALLKARA